MTPRMSWWWLMLPAVAVGLLFFRAIPEDEPVWHSLIVDGQGVTWTPIEKAPPPKGVRLLVKSAHGPIYARTDDRQHWRACATGEPIRSEVTHWAIG